MFDLGVCRFVRLTFRFSRCAEQLTRDFFSPHQKHHHLEYTIKSSWYIRYYTTMNSECICKYLNICLLKWEQRKAVDSLRYVSTIRWNSCLMFQFRIAISISAKFESFASENSPNYPVKNKNKMRQILWWQVVKSVHSTDTNRQLLRPCSWIFVRWLCWMVQNHRQSSSAFCLLTFLAQILK